MTPDDPHDPLDRELARQLGEFGGGSSDTEAALGALRPRARAARRRRQSALAGGTAAALAVVAGVVALAGGGDGGERVTTPATRPPDASTVPDPTTTTLPGSPTTTSTTPVTTPTTPVAPTVPSPPETRAFTNAGGSITVTLENGALRLDAANPAVGFEVSEQDVRADRIRIRFRNDDGDEHRIELRVENNEIVLERNE